MNKKLSDLLSVLLFCGFIGALFLIFLFKPPGDFSEVENRVLAQAPRLTARAVFSGDYMEDFETYLTDQFPGRDGWVDLKGLCERLLLKKEYKGVYLCADGTLMTRFDEPDAKLTERNLAAVNELAAQSDIPVYLALIPGAVSVWADRLPADAPNADQLALIRDLYARCEARTVDVAGALEAHRDEEIFYRTDHHWTTLGAYYGYTAFAEAAGFAPTPLSAYTPRVVSEDFRGTVYSSSGVHWTQPDRITLYVEQGGAEITNYPHGQPEEGVLYDMSRLETKDKYAMFYGGNTPRLVIRTEREDAPKLLILRDSYMDSESPFFFENFSEIHVLDLRYFRQSVAEYIAENGFDMILVSYNISNFVSDTAIVMAAG